MSFRVTIDNYLPTDEINNFGFPAGVIVRTKTLNINTTVSERSVASFTLIDKLSAGFHFNEIIGRPIEIWEHINGPFDSIESWELIFAGQVDEPETSKINRFIYRNGIVCIDHHAICDRIAVNQSYPKIYIHELIKQIVDDYLVDDGIWYGDESIQETDKEVQIVCPYVFCTQIFNELSALLNWTWKITPNKKLYFYDGSANVAAPIVETRGQLAHTLKVTPDRSDYRNTQILKNVKCEIESILEVAQPYPDGVLTTYEVIYEIQYKPRIFVTTWANKSHPLPAEEVDPDTIGIYGLDEAGTHAWYWNKGSKTVQQDGNEIPIAINLYVVIEYIPVIEFDIIRTDDDEIGKRQLIEGGSGIYTNVMDGSDLYGEELAEGKGDALLTRYARNAKKINFNSFDRYKTGEIRDVILPSYNINSLIEDGGGYLVWSVSIRDIGTESLLRTIDLIDGEPVGGWISFFKKWLSTENYFEIRTDLTTNIQLIQDEAVDYSEVLNVLRIDSLYPDVNLWPDVDLWPGTQITSHNYSN